jgi:hypothetical protein
MTRITRLNSALALLVLTSSTLRGQVPPEGQLRAAPRSDGTVTIEAESLLDSSRATHGSVARQNMRPFGLGWSHGEQLFWSVAQPGAQLQLTFRTAAAGRYQVFLDFTRAPDYGSARVSFDGAPNVSFSGYAPTVSRGRALLSVLDLAAGVHELLVQVIRKDGKSAGLYVGLDRVVLKPIAGENRTLELPPPPSEGRRTMHKPVVEAIAIPKIARAQLAFALFSGSGSTNATLGATEWSVYRPNLTVRLTWQASDVGKVTYRWQVASHPFSRGLTSSASPADLLAEGSAALSSLRAFEIALGSFPPLGTGPLSASGGPGTVGVNPVAVGAAPTSTGSRESSPRGSATVRAFGGVHLQDRPRDFYIRIIPIVDGQPAGPPSNTVIAHYLVGSAPDPEGQAFASDAERKARLEQMKEQAKVYQLDNVRFTPMVFQDPYRWGCIVVVKNPHFGEPDHPIRVYMPGHEYCGGPWEGMGKHVGVWDVVTGWAKAYDILATFYDDAKTWVADQIGKLAPCEAMGDKLEGSCQEFVKQAAAGAMSAGLVAAGVPPTLPNLNELKAAGEGKVAEAAADYTCAEFEAHGGQCTPEMRKALVAAYAKGIDQLQLGIVKAATEPGCGDLQEAHDHGVKALPCFTDYGAEVKPASGAVTEPAFVTLRVRRVKPNPPFALPGCRIRADLKLTNEFAGANLHGVDYGPDTLHGSPFLPPETGIPALPLGQPMDVTLVFSRYQPFALPKHHNATIWWDDWLRLYTGGHGPLSAFASTVTPVPGAKEFNGTMITLACAEDAQATVQIPK